MIDVIASEWLKFRSLRSNLFLLAVSVLAVLISAGLAFMIGRGLDSNAAEDRLTFTGVGDGLGTGLSVAYFIVGALGALSITSEHASGQIRTSLTAVPRRQILLFSKIPTLLVVGLVAGQVLAFAMHFASQAILGGHAGLVLLNGQTMGASLSEPGVLAGVLIAGASVPLVALIGLGLGAVIRSTAGSLVVLIMILFVLPVATKTLPSPGSARIGAFMIENLPGQIAGNGLLSPLAAAALLLAYPVAALAAGAVAIAARGRRIRPLAAGLVVTALLGAVVAAPTAATTSTLRWKACGTQGLECAVIQVPVDWAKPEGRTITLPLARLATNGTGHRIGTVFAIPGGPGGSGVEDLKNHAGNFTALRDRFDVVSFVPRNGWNLGVLTKDCFLSGPWIVPPKNSSEYGRLAETNQKAAERCRNLDPAFFDHMDSASVARDIDTIRAALGEERLSFIATSYGGVPAVAYSRLFPGRIRAMYLDGIVNQLLDPEADARKTYAETEAMFARFIAWSDATATSPLHGRDVGATWRELIARADRSPIPVRGESQRAAYSGFDLKLAVGPNLFGPGAASEYPRWRQLAEAIKQAERGDASGFADYIKVGTGSLKARSTSGVNMVHCADGMRFADYAEYERNRALGERLSPHFAGNRLWHPLGCVGWPAPTTNPPTAMPTTKLPPFLGAGTWTDYDGTADLAMRVPGSGTVRFDGPGHGLYLTGDSCTIAHANRYLTQLKLPPTGTVCRPPSAL
ncbi:alpha/beta fold hydrolase [Nonomuraea sp. NPDC059194]|uniref:alpha/beta fold hydrolase n=1 Tax=Nonomuraea sp. NPDC059194 TaxID=3346764 RepID=UPI0036BA2225